MTLTPRDRRGLGEIIAFSSVTVAVGLVCVAYLARGHEPPKELVAALIGLALLVLARGTQSASERSGSVEQRNVESAELRRAISHFDARADRLEAITLHIIDAKISETLPALPPKDKL